MDTAEELDTDDVEATRPTVETPELVDVGISELDAKVEIEAERLLLELAEAKLNAVAVLEDAEGEEEALRTALDDEVSTAAFLAVGVTVDYSC